MKRFLIVFYLSVLAAMTYATLTATLDRGLMTAGRELWPDAWFRATLLDAYLAFLTFYIWVAYKETNGLSRVLWLVAILALGNFAIAAYMLKQLTRTRSFSWTALLLREPAAAD